MTFALKELHTIEIVGGGLAGCEAAWQAAQRGVRVVLFEMKPTRFSPAHRIHDLAELVCSNSFRSASPENAVGVLKEEMRRLGSLIMQASYATRVPAGGSLAVDRAEFARFVTHALEEHPLVEIRRQAVSQVEGNTLRIIATGPLTSDEIASDLARLTKENSLYFYDAISPIVETESLNNALIFRASRYNKGGTEGDYLNCPMTEEEYRRFWEQLIHAEKVEAREFEDIPYFEGCLPIEVMARRGYDTLLFGPMKPVGLRDPGTGKRPFAVVQLRQEDAGGNLYNMVGFQTKLTYREQERIFRMIPGLKCATFARLGSIHRNTFINGPRCLEKGLRLRGVPGVRLAGQITGVEGYVESAAVGLIAGIHAAREIRGLPILPPPPETAHGALIRYITTGNGEHFQPMNVTFGLFKPVEHFRGGKKERRRLLAYRALEMIEEWKKHLADGTSPCTDE
ncbi:MAG: methylenetetrahydrofolate--tRNA-(uracil(54)-C(5))-methyltransferase (FADH(2)-oxidizing) TrmFO [Deltaproteobacteria bacterium]|nr:methylenetetrahydrofolate--tRNA-(uracil(54)-C(5))-methyltransferase (FADH(2)-oxidizing) TrmFO [Deltaproteobacteria bacterium]